MTGAQANLKLALALMDAGRAITALYLELAEPIVNDVKQKVETAFAAYTAALDAREREVWQVFEQRMQELIDAYPTDVFVEPPKGQHGDTVDACPARMGRHVGKMLLEWCHRQGGEK